MSCGPGIGFPRRRGELSAETSKLTMRRSGANAATAPDGGSRTLSISGSDLVLPPLWSRARRHDHEHAPRNTRRDAAPSSTLAA